MSALLAAQGAAASMSRMSRQGNCDDDAGLERLPAAVSQTRLWATLKAECFHGERPAPRPAAQWRIFDSSAGFYHRTRLHGGLSYQSPLAFETNLRYNQNSPSTKTTKAQPTFSKKDQLVQAIFHIPIFTGRWWTGNLLAASDKFVTLLFGVLAGEDCATANTGMNCAHRYQQT